MKLLFAQVQWSRKHQEQHALLKHLDVTSEFHIQICNLLTIFVQVSSLLEPVSLYRKTELLSLPWNIFPRLDDVNQATGCVWHIIVLNDFCSTSLSLTKPQASRRIIMTPHLSKAPACPQIKYLPHSKDEKISPKMSRTFSWSQADK